MGFLHATRRLTAGIAILAMLLASLAPAITHALAAARDQHYRWTEVCTAEGARFVPVPTDADGVPFAPGPHALDHCPFCSPAGTSPSLLPPEPAAVPAAANHDFITALHPREPRPLPLWAAVQPRAPPRITS